MLQERARMVVYHVALSFVCGADAAYSAYMSGTMVPRGLRRPNEVERAEFAAVRASNRAQPEQLAHSLFPNVSVPSEHSVTSLERSRD